ncbi:MAG: hypothetical protein ABH843_01820 [Candidatus Omnitrophota bacterium]
MKKIAIIYMIIITAVALTRWAEAGNLSEPESRTLTLSQSLKDGAAISLHYDPQALAKYQSYPDRYAGLILRYALEAYDEIVYDMGFNSPGFTFINPDSGYCQDKDKNIDIYIRDSEPAPSYDVVAGEGTDYDAIILFPADYTGYITKWFEHSPAEYDVDSRIRASIFHEMFHAITYTYNKNIEGWYTESEKGRGDWYVEGLARYIETISGSFDNFFAKGFVKKGKNGKDIIFHAGVNYLMEHPDESLVDARYNYALFWAYIDKKYGMKKIEEISRRLRFISSGNIARELPALISMALAEDFEDIMEGFAIAVYFKHFNPDIKKGLSELKIMSWEDFSTKGPKSISSWGSNFITLDISGKAYPRQIAIQKNNNKKEMHMNVFCRMESGKLAHLRKVELNGSDNLCAVDLYEMRQVGVKEVILILTNVDADGAMLYNLLQA